jgi:hypothetical protein
VSIEDENTQEQDTEEKNVNFKLVEDVPEGTSTDVITDLKSGIYNLFLSLLNHLIVQEGPIEAVKISTQFLDQISNTFKQTLEQK